MIEFYIDRRVDLKPAFPHGPLTLRTLNVAKDTSKSL